MTAADAARFIADLLAADDDGARLAFWMYDDPPWDAPVSVWLCVGR